MAELEDKAEGSARSDAFVRRLGQAFSASASKKSEKLRTRSTARAYTPDVSPGKSGSTASAVLLDDLRRALLAADDAAVRVSCAALGVPAEQTDHFKTQAGFVAGRARGRLPAASNTEVELALGVLLALFMPAAAPAEAAR
ncbi:MAG: hypothetical protein ABI548_30200 [Polyangiaceae bacterium]